MECPRVRVSAETVKMAHSSIPRYPELCHNPCHGSRSHGSRSTFVQLEAFGPLFSRRFSVKSSCASVKWSLLVPRYISTDRVLLGPVLESSTARNHGTCPLDSLSGHRAGDVPLMIQYYTTLPNRRCGEEPPNLSEGATPFEICVARLQKKRRGGRHAEMGRELGPGPALLRVSFMKPGG